MNLPIYTSYENLTEKKLLEITWCTSEGIERNDKGEITTVWLYADDANPTDALVGANKAWENYFKRLRTLSGLVEKYT
ncbi:hypothetical protein [Spirosoma fluminis]